MSIVARVKPVMSLISDATRLTQRQGRAPITHTRVSGTDVISCHP